MFNKTKGTKGQGNVGVASAILYFLKEGGIISIPLNDSQEYDLIVDIDGKLNKVQVKTTKYTTKHGIYVASLVSSGGSKRQIYHSVCESDCNFLFVLCSNGVKYLIPREVFIKNKKAINLGKDLEKFIVT